MIPSEGVDRVLKLTTEDDGSVSDCATSANGSGSGSASATSASATSASAAGSASAVVAPSALRRGRYSSSSLSPSPTYVKSKSRHGFLEENRNATKGGGKTVNVNIIPSSVRSFNNKNSGIHDELPSYASLPNGLVIGDSGHILGRCSRRALFFKKSWREFVWVHCKPVTILIFRSPVDAQKWMNAKYLRNNEKKLLIKYSIDFDLMGFLKGNGDKSEGVNQSPPSVKKFVMADVRTKRTKIDGSIRHQFLVEKWSRVGTRVEVAFASSDVMEVKNIRKALRKCIKKVSNRNKNGRRSCEDEGTDASVLNSVLSDATGTTQVSSSTYHISTLDSYATSRRSTRKHRGFRSRAAI